MTEPRKEWAGEFGKAYTDRNVIDWRLRLPAFREMLKDISVRTVLEVGCNRGHNLVALRELLGADSELTGVEPNAYARELGETASGVTIKEGRADQLPFGDGQFDLVFTAGVLIHISPSELPHALAEIHRVSRRYILAIEYFAKVDEEIVYRGQSGLLWKRNFLQHYQSRFSALKLLGSGYWTAEQGFDRCHWWLLEKTK